MTLEEAEERAANGFQRTLTGGYWANFDASGKPLHATRKGAAWGQTASVPSRHTKVWEWLHRVGAAQAASHREELNRLRVERVKGDSEGGPLLEAAKSGAGLAHGVFADWLEERNLHHDEDTLYRMRVSADTGVPVAYHMHSKSGRVVASHHVLQEDDWSPGVETFRGPGGVYGLTGVQHFPEHGISGRVLMGATHDEILPEHNHEEAREYARQKANAGHTRLARKDAAFKAGPDDLVPLLHAVHSNSTDHGSRGALADYLEMERPDLLHDTASLYHLRDQSRHVHIGGHKGRVWASDRAPAIIHSILAAIGPINMMGHGERMTGEEAARHFRIHIVNGPRGTWVVHHQPENPEGLQHLVHLYHPVYGMSTEGRGHTRASALGLANRLAHAPMNAEDVGRLAKEDDELQEALAPVKKTPYHGVYDGSATPQAHIDLLDYLSEKGLHHNEADNRFHLVAGYPVVFHKHRRSGRVIVSPRYSYEDMGIPTYSGPGGSAVVMHNLDQPRADNPNAEVIHTDAAGDEYSHLVHDRAAGIRVPRPVSHLPKKPVSTREAAMAEAHALAARLADAGHTRLAREAPDSETHELAAEVNRNPRSEVARGMLADKLEEQGSQQQKPLLMLRDTEAHPRVWAAPHPHTGHIVVGAGTHPFDALTGGCNRRWNSHHDNLSQMIRGYAEAALWSSNHSDEDGGNEEPLDENHGIHDIHPTSALQMIHDVSRFYHKHRAALEQHGTGDPESEAYNTGFEAASQGMPRHSNPHQRGTYNHINWHAGHDEAEGIRGTETDFGTHGQRLWLNSQGHGTGFWDHEYPQELTDDAGKLNSDGLYLDRKPGEDTGVIHHNHMRPLRLGKLESPDRWTHDAAGHRLEATKEGSAWSLRFSSAGADGKPTQSPGDRYAVNGSAGHGAVGVMRAMHGGLSEFLHTQKPEQVHIHANADEPSRVSLYHRVLPGLAASHGYTASHESDGSLSKHTLTRAPGKLAKKTPHPVTGISTALRDYFSKNQQAREYVAKNLVAQSGEPGTVLGLLHHRPEVGFRAGVMSVLHNCPEPLAHRIAPYLAAYQGLLSQDPHTVAFVTGNGPDLLHHLHMPVPVEEAADTMTKAGFTHFAITPQDTRSLAHVYDAGGRLSQDIASFVTGVKGTTSATAGTGRRLGSLESAADARVGYRRMIAATEGHAAGPAKLAAIPGDKADTVTVQRPVAPGTPAPAAAPAAPKPSVFILPG